MLGGILAFLPGRGSLCAWEKGDEGRGCLRGWRRGRAGGRKGCLNRSTGATVWSEWCPYKWPWHRAEETQGEDELNYSSSMDAFDFRRGVQWVVGLADQLGEVRVLRKWEGLGMDSFLDGEQSLAWFGMEGLERARARVIISFICDH